MANKKQNKNITLTSLKQKNKIYNETIEVEIDGYSLKINKLFSKVKTTELTQEFLTNLNETVRNDSVNISSAYIYLLMIRHFTSLGIPKELDKQMEWLSELIDSGYFTEIIGKFPVDQVSNVIQEVTDALQNINQNMPLVQEKLSELEIENDEVKKQLLNITPENTE